jgi:prolyl oligopeptidase
VISKRLCVNRLVVALGSMGAAAVLTSCASPPTPTSVAPSASKAAPMINADAADPYAWLEEVQGERAMAWVKAENQRTVDALTRNPRFKAIESQALGVIESSERIPFVEKLGDAYYNLWRDAKNPRGLWRRTSLAEYRKPMPAWEPVLDLDALNKSENQSFVWAGAECLKPANTRCLISLSPGGSDAKVVREFDLTTKQWVAGGFVMPQAKGSLTWEDADTVLTSIAQDDASSTESGYGRIVKRWKRGTPLAQATTVFTGQRGDVGTWPSVDAAPGMVRSFVTRATDFYNDELYWLAAGAAPRKVDVPDSAFKIVNGAWLILRLRNDWRVGTQTYRSGSLLATPFDAWMRGERKLDVLYEANDKGGLVRVEGRRPFIKLKDHIVVPVLEDVRHVVHVLTPTPQGWQRRTLSGIAPLDRVQMSSVDEHASNALWLTTTGFLEPTTLSLADMGASGGAASAPERLKGTPAFFDASKHVVEQHFAISKDGTRVPYFLITAKNKPAAQRLPTVLFGYGGFEVPMLPSYSGTRGRAWLERGGAFVVANIRGGGEYGPRWHQAALKANRPRAFEDFAAVGDDLVKRGITTPAQLAVMGGSNGGLLTGNMLVRYPEQLGGVVIQVPLLDMKRYNKLLAGASWMAEYGDPDKPQEWAFLKTFSPYHLVEKASARPQGKTYPPAIILTSTKDDRVHPGHARKMAALLKDAGHPVTYYENIEGGHAGAASPQQEAFMSALMYEFLWQSLAK